VAIYLLDIYRSSNIGIFLKSNSGFLLVPKGLAETKVAKLSKYLGLKAVETSIGGSRLLGPLIAMNSRGILVSRLAEDVEVRSLREATGLLVERLPTRYTSVGNLIAANDRGAVVSPLLLKNKDAEEVIRDTLDVQLEYVTVASYMQVGSMIVPTNTGVAVHPRASEDEIMKIAETLRVDAQPATVNGGVPFVASGIVATDLNAVVGSLTSGPELIMLSRIFKV